jgi:hypothetical protein
MVLEFLSKFIMFMLILCRGDRGIDYVRLVWLV